jgi:hypothetical protein
MGEFLQLCVVSKPGLILFFTLVLYVNESKSDRKNIIVQQKFQKEIKELYVFHFRRATQANLIARQIFLVIPWLRALGVQK